MSIIDFPLSLDARYRDGTHYIHVCYCHPCACIPNPRTRQHKTGRIRRKGGTLAWSRSAGQKRNAP